MKKMTNMKGVKILFKSQQKSVFGGNPHQRCIFPKIDCYNPITHHWSCKVEAACAW